MSDHIAEAFTQSALAWGAAGLGAAARWLWVLVCIVLVVRAVVIIIGSKQAPPDAPERLGLAHAGAAPAAAHASCPRLVR